VQRVNELFIFAATIANFIEDQNASDPVDQLKVVHGQDLHRVAGDFSASPNSDALYSSCFERRSEHQRAASAAGPDRAGDDVLLFDSLDPEGLEACSSWMRILFGRPSAPAFHCDPSRGWIWTCFDSSTPTFHDFYVDRERCDD